MKVMVIVKASRSSEAGEMPSERMLTEMGKFNEELVKAGVMLSGDGLHPSSRGARVRFSGANRTVVDGPFAETKELIAGFWIWRVKSLEEAIEWVKRCPNPMPEESEIEIRQVFDAEDFGTEFTPELREQEAVLRAQTLGLNEPRFENGPALRIAGPQQSYTPQTRQGIPAQWTKFAPHIGTLAGQVGSSAYGVCLNATKDGNFDYLTGVEVSAAAKLPADFQQAELPAQRYIVFTHTQHVSLLPQTIDAIWTKWAPDCGLRLGNGACFERYTAEFNPQTGLGGMELWVPLQA